MNIEEFRKFCLTIKGAEECFPFDEDTLVFKTLNKMFAFISLTPKDGVYKVNLKCDPDKAIILREKYNCVIPGYHSNKRLWNTVEIDSHEMPDTELMEWVNHSVEEVVKKLSKKIREEYYKE